MFHIIKNTKWRYTAGPASSKSTKSCPKFIWKDLTYVFLYAEIFIVAATLKAVVYTPVNISAK